jgi:hypothetical protein
MNSQLFYYFSDPRIQYSLEQLQSLLKDGLIDSETIVHTICLPFKAGDLIQHVAPIVDNLVINNTTDYHELF